MSHHKKNMMVCLITRITSYYYTSTSSSIWHPFKWMGWCSHHNLKNTFFLYFFFLASVRICLSSLRSLDERWSLSYVNIGAMGGAAHFLVSPLVYLSLHCVWIKEAKRQRGNRNPDMRCFYTRTNKSGAVTMTDSQKSTDICYKTASVNPTQTTRTVL